MLVRPRIEGLAPMKKRAVPSASAGRFPDIVAHRAVAQMPYLRIGSDLGQKTDLVARQVFQEVTELFALPGLADLVDDLAHQLLAGAAFALVMEQASQCKQIDERHVMNGIATHER